MVRDLIDFSVLQTYINGELVAENGQSLIAPVAETTINRFDCAMISDGDLRVAYNSEATIPVIEALDGQLITNRLMLPPTVMQGLIVPDIERDILKVVVVNRYKTAPVAKAFIRNFAFKSGAIASSVAHDSHNIIAVGVDDESIARAVNLVIEHKGGVSCINGPEEKVIALPVAGLMSNEDGYKVAAAYTAIDRMAKSMGSSLSAPFMTLSFMALLVIPKLKLSDFGLFDGEKFEFVHVQ